MASKVGKAMTAQVNPIEEYFHSPTIPVLISRDDTQMPTETEPLLLRQNNARERPSEDVHFRDIERSHFWWLFGCIMFASLIAFFDGTLMVSSHPVITSYFRASNSSSWLSTVFYLTSTVSQPLYGRSSDVVGRRVVFLFALFLFFISTAWCGLAQNIGSFIAARAVCGMGAGGVTAMTIILISDVIKLEYRGIYQSYFNVAWGCGNGLGAALGGILCEQLGWRAAFGIQLPFIFATYVVAFMVVPEDLGPNLAAVEGKTIFQALMDFDTPGAIALTMTITCMILGINLGGNVLTWAHPVVISSLLLFMVAAVTLILVERRKSVKRPILPLPLLTTFPIANLIWSNFLSAAITNIVLFNVPVYLQAVRQASPTTSGLYLISPLIAASLFGVFSGLWITWTRQMKPLIIAGAFMFLIGSVSVTCLSREFSSWTLLLLIPGVSIAQGLNWPPTTIAVLSLNSQDNQAVATTTLSLLRYIGAILGVAMSSWIFQNALLYILDELVTAPTAADKADIILKVRESIAAIASLDPQHKSQVIEGYARALRITFASSIVFSILVICITIPVKLPDLRRKMARYSTVDEEEPPISAAGDSEPIGDNVTA